MSGASNSDSLKFGEKRIGGSLWTNRNINQYKSLQVQGVWSNRKNGDIQKELHESESE
jgi:hypothetical protein